MLPPHPFDDEEVALNFIQKNIGVFFTIITAAGVANIDLMELSRNQLNSLAEKACENQSR